VIVVVAGTLLFLTQFATRGIRKMAHLNAQAQLRLLDGDKTNAKEISKQSLSIAVHFSWPVEKMDEIVRKAREAMEIQLKVASNENEQNKMISEWSLRGNSVIQIALKNVLETRWSKQPLDSNIKDIYSILQNGENWMLLNSLGGEI
jgi:hypothetical protein